MKKLNKKSLDKNKSSNSTEEDDVDQDMSNLQIFQDIKVELEDNTKGDGTRGTRLDGEL